MIVVQMLPPPQSNIWYLAYGSNLSASKFIDDRGIVPLETATVTVPGWTLVMDSVGFPYSEPAFASITPIQRTEKGKPMQLIGTAYKLTPEMYIKVLASEGGGIAYAEVEIRGEMVEEDNIEAYTFPVRTLTTLLHNEARPSSRYMDLLKTGARDSEMPVAYQKFLSTLPVYHPSTRLRNRIGAELFLSFWRPVMQGMEKVTKASLKGSKTGVAPIWVLMLVRAAMVIMWLHHDLIHAPIWGRGDGMER